MKAITWKQYAAWILIVELVGVLSGILSADAMNLYNQTAIRPELTPPPVVFPVVWTILYALMGIGWAKIWYAPESAWRSWGLNLFVAQLIFNFFWSLIFFNAQAYGFAALWLAVLWILTACMIIVFYKVDKSAALLQIPYLLWLTFAGYLNISVWRLNP